MRLDRNKVQLRRKDDDAHNERGGNQVPHNHNYQYVYKTLGRVIDAYEGKPMFTLAGYQNNKVPTCHVEKLK